jgi:hypothetical protein
MRPIIGALLQIRFPDVTEQALFKVLWPDVRSDYPFRDRAR